MKTTNKQSGFTILELLVVIAIIGILAAITIGFLSSSRPKGRDAKRIEEIRSLQGAIELKASKNNGGFLGTGTAGETDLWSTNGVSQLQSRLNGTHPTEEESYITVVPKDPQYDSSGETMAIWYTATSTVPGDNAAADYTIRFCLETEQIPGFAPGCNNTVGS